MPQPKEWMIAAADEWIWRDTGVHDRFRAKVIRLADIIASEYEKAHAPATPATPDFDSLAVELCRELYDRFMMGGWQPQDAYAETVFRLMKWYEPVAEAAPTTPELKSRLEKIIEEVKALKADREALIHALTCPLDWCDKCKPADDILRARAGQGRKP